MSASSEKNSLFSLLKDASGKALFNLLTSISGKKDLVLDKQLIGSLDYIVNYSQLLSCGVEKVYKLEPGDAPGVTDKCIYLIRSSIPNCKIIADHINAFQRFEKEKQFWIIHCPRRLCCSEQVLEKEGVYDDITEIELPIYFFPLDKDLFSLQVPDFFQSFFLKKDLIFIHTAAVSLVQLCSYCGPIPKIFGQGRCAEMVIDLMDLIMEDMEFETEAHQSKRISHLIILDRDIDYVSVLLSQLTYEGMLDEVFGINNSCTIFPTEVTKKDNPLKVKLTSTDVIYKEIRDSYFASVFLSLRSKAKELQAKSETTNMSVADMKKFVTDDIKHIKLQKTSLALHIGACEVIMKKKSEANFQEHLQIERNIIENHNSKECLEYIEDLINQQESKFNVLRLMCLLCIAQDGLLLSEYKSLGTQFRQSFGCKYLPLLYNLKKLGLLMPEQSSALSCEQTTASKIAEKVNVSKLAERIATLSTFNSFKTVLRKFNLIPNEEESDLRNPKNMSYVFGGAYVPLIGKITEHVVVNGSFKLVEDGMKLLPGKTIMNFKSDKKTGSVKPASDFDSKTVLVYILGGITFAEVAALRLLGQINGCQILIATTSLINGNSFLQSL